MRAREALLFFGLGVSAVLAGAAAYTSYPLVTNLAGQEIFGPIQQNGADYTVTAQQLQNYVNGTNSYSKIYNNSSPTTAFIYDIGTEPNGIVLSGTYSNAALNLAMSASPAGVVMADNQEICWVIISVRSCLYHNNGQLVYFVGATRIFSVSDSTGNAIFKGTVTQSGSP
jgi:hypothetical protein